MADDEDGVGAALPDAHCVREAGAAAVARGCAGQRAGAGEIGARVSSNQGS